jgi:hypothetical protein
VASGGTLNVAHDSALSILALNIAVTDSDSDNVSLAGSVSNTMLTGINNAEFSSAPAPAPYALAPVSGKFVKGGVTHVVTLTADDGRGGSVQFTFSIVVGNASGGSNGSGALAASGGSGGCAANTYGAAWWSVVLPLLWLLRRKAGSPKCS